MFAFDGFAFLLKTVATPRQSDPYVGTLNVARPNQTRTGLLWYFSCKLAGRLHDRARGLPAVA
jgi:hypothetical protein